MTVWGGPPFLLIGEGVPAATITSSSSKANVFSNGASAIGSATSAASRLAAQVALGRNSGVAGAEPKNDAGMPPLVFAEQPWQPDGCRALHCAKPERPARFRVLDGTARFIGKREQALRVAKQHLAGWREVKPFALPNEKRNGQILLKLPDTGRDIGLH